MNLLLFKVNFFVISIRTDCFLNQMLNEALFNKFFCFVKLMFLFFHFFFINLIRKISLPPIFI